MKQETSADNELRDAISTQYNLLVEAFAKGDASIISRQFFTPDAWAVGEGTETAIEAEQIEKLYSDFVGNFTYAVKSACTRRTGDAGWDFAEVTLRSTDGSDEIHLYKVLYLWTKQDGRWRCRGQMYVEGSFKGATH